MGIPYLTAITSAKIDTAIFGGVRAPMNKPTGPSSRSTCSWVTSNSSRRSLRFWVFTLLPNAPTKKAEGFNASMRTMSSSLGSRVKATTVV